jgi:hypothetical protein
MFSILTVSYSQTDQRYNSLIALPYYNLARRVKVLQGLKLDVLVF